MNWLSRALTCLVLAAAMTGLVACEPGAPSRREPTAENRPNSDLMAMPLDRVTGPFPVMKVVDGDTIWVERDGNRVKVRLIGLDTPETQDPRKGVQCFGVEASDRAKESMSGRSVYLEADSSQGVTDRFGRELAYVWTAEGNLINFDMISESYGYEYTYDVPY